MSKVVDNYLVMEKIGEGQFSVVHKGKHVKTGELVAVKILDAKKYDENPHIQAMISEEIEALSRVSHPNIIKHLRYLRTTNNMYEVYNYFEGGDLNNYLNQYGKFELGEALKLFMDLVSAVKALYENKILHRDIKPENIFIENGRGHIGDFGLCRILDEREQLIEGAYGSPMYMSPESLQNMKYGLKSDLYSIGIILFEIIFGNVPYHCNTIEELLKLIHNVGPKFDDELVDIPIRVKNLILRLVEPNPEKRISHSELFNIVLEDETFLFKYSHEGSKFGSSLNFDEILSGKKSKKTEENQLKMASPPKSPMREIPVSRTEPISPVNQKQDTRRQSMYQKQYEESFTINPKTSPKRKMKRGSGSKKSLSRRGSGSKKSLSRRGSRGSIEHHHPQMNHGLPPPTPTRGPQNNMEMYNHNQQNPNSNPYIHNPIVNDDNGIYFPNNHDDIMLENAIFNADSQYIENEKDKHQRPMIPQNFNSTGKPKKNHYGYLQSEFVNENNNPPYPEIGFNSYNNGQSNEYYGPPPPQDYYEQPYPPQMHQNQNYYPPVDYNQMDPINMAKNRVITPQQSDPNLRGSSEYNSAGSFENTPMSQNGQNYYYQQHNKPDIFGRANRKVVPETPPNEIINSRRTSMGVSPNRQMMMGPKEPPFNGYSPSEGNLHQFYNKPQMNQRKMSQNLPPVSNVNEEYFSPPEPVLPLYAPQNQNFTFDEENKNRMNINQNQYHNQDNGMQYNMENNNMPLNQILPRNQYGGGLTNYTQNTETFGKIKRISTKNSLRHINNQKPESRNSYKKITEPPQYGLFTHQDNILNQLPDEESEFILKQESLNKQLVHHSFGEYREELSSSPPIKNIQHPSRKINPSPLPIMVIDESKDHKTPPPSISSKKDISLLVGLNNNVKNGILNKKEKIVLESEFNGIEEKKLKRTFSTYGIRDWVEEAIFMRSKYKFLIKMAKKTLRLREVSNLSITVILLLMKLAYEKYNDTKQLISIGSIASRHHDPSQIFVSKEFNLLQSVINSEELPIAMFLSNLKKLISLGKNVSDLVQIEMSNLSKICCSKVQIEAIISSHIQILVHNRGVFSRVDNILRYCLDLHDCINIDHLFNSQILKGKKFEENQVCLKRIECNETELLDQIIFKGFNL